ncbi:hypothetical protein N657DRAFT_693266 [Parathielavia appendiculata]|uniref:Zn(2)-C6 fungal-type domain-containing protein n=1 Tax=Parathielavia appendiculata TaxID=2587402 RepID=A0AAN6TSY9_9PEZI|nr:hypothetical protein N657DRAFT_693266 [Parathielavia appendiculata]
MTDVVTEWLHYHTHQPPKRKRADLVCLSCHSKKVKCDLQSKGDGICSNCDSAGRECQIYPSKRKKSNRELPQDATHANGYRRSPSLPDETRIDSPAPAASPQPQTPMIAIQALPTAPQLPPSATLPTIVIPTPHRRQDQCHQQRQQRQQQEPQRCSPCQQQSQPQQPVLSLNGTPPSQQGVDPAGAPTGRSNPSDVDTGFLHVFGPENQIDAEQQEFEASLGRGYKLSDTQQQELQQIFAETYLEYCYTWCPVLDMDSLSSDTLRSSLLGNALALVGSHIRPPLIPHDGPAAYYKKATSILYNDEEADGLATLQAIALFYWWAPRSPAVAHRHSSWWWTSVLIRHAQQMNFHREPSPHYPHRDALNLGLRRRIWWTAFARERLTALCQSKPCIIDPADCNIKEPTLADFPPDPKMQRKGEIFIYWVRLCAIMGRIAKSLSRSASSTYTPSPASPTSPAHLRQELVDWVHSLPLHLQLPIGSNRTDSELFDRDVHQLHLPYLTTIIVLHLRRQPGSGLPQALPPAILAASCIARILRDILSRGDARFLMPITCWYSGTAFIALLQACRVASLAGDASDGLDVLTHAVEHLRQMWGSAKVVRQAFDRLRQSHAEDHGNATATQTRLGPEPGPGSTPGGAGRPGAEDVHLHAPPSLLPLGGTSARAPCAHDEADFDWTALFPFVTRSTGGIANALIPGPGPGMATRFPSPESLLFQESFMLDYHGLLEPFGYGDDGMPL